MTTQTLTLLPPTATFWRISIYDALDGAGAAFGGGRWNTPGRPVVYLAETPAGAMLEVLAHLPSDEGESPASFRLLRLESKAAAEIRDLSTPNGERWQWDLQITRNLGDEWLQAADAALVRVPSAIMPFTWNYLLNPLHSDAGKVSVARASEHLHDPRLLRVRER